ncbi:MAG: MFS transporter [Actinomycetota bacterium]|nr:MFS transporter [Actinomycetota bacterium]MDQ2956454.1 MFS transporter [Actinomycetota bacterium]
MSLFMGMLDNTVVNTALPTISARLAAGVSDLQWILDGYRLSLAALTLTASTVGDLYGRRRIFIGGLLLFAAGSACCALSDSVGTLIAGRIAQGTGAAAFLPATLSIIRQVFTDERERAVAIGVWAGVSGLGLGLGPLIGGPLVDNFGWPSVFWINVPIGLAGSAAAMLIPESSDRGGRSIDIGGQLLAIAGIGGLVFATIEGPARGWQDPAVLGCYCGAAIVLAAFVILERRSHSPLLDLELLQDRIFTGSVLSGLFLYFGMFSVLYFLSLWLQQVLGWSATGAGLAIMPAMVVVAAVTPVAGYLSGRFGGGLPMVAGLLVSAVALLGLTHFGTDASYHDFWWLLPVIGLGMGLTLTPITATVLSRVPAQRAGMGSAVSTTARELGGVLGVAALGSLLTAKLTGQLHQTLRSLGLGPAEIATAISGQSRSGSPDLAASGQSPQVHRAVLAAYVQGLHTAEYAGAAVLLLAALLAVALVRTGRDVGPDDEPAGILSEPSAEPAR